MPHVRDINYIIGRNIHEELYRRQMTQRELAERTGINLRMVQRYIRGELDIPVRKLFLFADAFEMDPADLLEGDYIYGID